VRQTRRDALRQKGPFYDFEVEDENRIQHGNQKQGDEGGNAEAFGKVTFLESKCWYDWEFRASTHY
jgi:hypothetical protein